MDLDKAWETVTCLLCKNDNVTTSQDLQSSVQLLEKVGLAEVIEEWFYETVQQDMRNRIAPEFWSHFQDPMPPSEVFDKFGHIFDKLYSDLSSYFTHLDRLEVVKSYMCCQPKSLLARDQRSSKDHMRLLYKAILFSSATKHFQAAVQQFYYQAYKAFDASTKTSIDLNDSENSEPDSLNCEGCDQERISCQCGSMLTRFHQLNKQLHDLNLLERISGDAVTSLIYQRIKQHIEQTCRGNFEAQYLESLEKWLNTKVVGWLELLYGRLDSSPMESDTGGSNPVASYKGKLFHYVYEIYARTRIEQLFDIVVEYPESELALQDLHTCLGKTQLRSTLVQSLRHALETRLLHPGVNTTDILTAYICAIRALRILDPSGVLLDLICEPVRRYLRNRSDTVRCIVTSLTEDGCSELSDELVKSDSLILDESYHSNDDSENWENWQPDPVDADPAKSGSSRRSSDIISMLVNIYGSKELFVNEYRTLLADRILTHFNYDTQKEVRYLELLKLRFGEAQLHYCEVMLKDVADSKRINAHISEQREKLKRDTENLIPVDEDIPVNAMILSAQFWPTFREEKLQVPEVMQKLLKKYCEAFEMLKGNRTLTWKPHLGLVDLDIELKDKTLSLKVSPVHATIIWHFQEKSEWTIDELSSVMQMPAHALRRKMSFWQSHGLLKEKSTDTFVLVEEHKGRTHDTVVIDEDEKESAMASAQDQKEEEYQVIWQYVVGMLTNLDSLPLDRIHSMLKMFTMQGPGSDCTIQELKALLDRKVKEQKLLCTSGVYRLPKPGS